jgi:hypothetical protein
MAVVSQYTAQAKDYRAIALSISQNVSVVGTLASNVLAYFAVNTAMTNPFTLLQFYALTNITQCTYPLFLTDQILLVSCSSSGIYIFSAGANSLTFSAVGNYFI